MALVLTDVTLFRVGNCSNFFPMPASEVQNVSNFFADYSPTWTDKSKYNISRNAREYQDVSASGFNYTVIKRGKTDSICGTSLSTPIFGSVVIPIHQDRLATDRRVVGSLTKIFTSTQMCLKISLVETIKDVAPMGWFSISKCVCSGR